MLCFFCGSAAIDNCKSRTLVFLSVLFDTWRVLGWVIRHHIEAETRVLVEERLSLSVFPFLFLFHWYRGVYFDGDLCVSWGYAGARRRLWEGVLLYILNLVVDHNRH